jgi:hypothetical protein
VLSSGFFGTLTITLYPAQMSVRLTPVGRSAKPVWISRMTREAVSDDRPKQPRRPPATT